MIFLIVDKISYSLQFSFSQRSHASYILVLLLHATVYKTLISYCHVPIFILYIPTRYYYIERSKNDRNDCQCLYYIGHLALYVFNVDKSFQCIMTQVLNACCPAFRAHKFYSVDVLMPHTSFLCFRCYFIYKIYISYRYIHFEKET